MKKGTKRRAGGTCRREGCSNPTRLYTNPSNGNTQHKTYCSSRCMDVQRVAQRDPDRQLLLDVLAGAIRSGQYQRHNNTDLIVDAILEGAQIHQKTNLSGDRRLTCWYCGAIAGPDTHYKECTV